MATEDVDEDDYMSDKFLENCINLRPGLVSKSTSRQYQLEKNAQEANKQNQLKRKKESEKMRRDDGLNSKIGKDNKGFALLQKMGFKPGTALGKEGQGRAEPVSINVKNNREGLGMESERKQRQEEMSQMRAKMMHKRQKVYHQQQSGFQQRMSEKFTEREFETDLAKSQRVCDELDGKANIEEPKEWFFWPLYWLEKKSAKEEDEESEEPSDPVMDLYTPQEKLEMLTCYLRNTYFYCVWCGIHYKDEKDIKNNCPGNTRSDHD